MLSGTHGHSEKIFEGRREEGKESEREREWVKGRDDKSKLSIVDK